MAICCLDEGLSLVQGHEELQHLWVLQETYKGLFLFPVVMKWGGRGGT